MSNKLLALVVEDHPDQAFVFESALNKAGFETEVYNDGQLAHQRLAEVTPDVIVLDLHIPHISGEELLAQIRSDPRLAGMHVALATADARLAEKLERQAQMVLLKPVSFSQLSGLMKRIGKRISESRVTAGS